MNTWIFFEKAQNMSVYSQHCCTLFLFSHPHFHSFQITVYGIYFLLSWTTELILLVLVYLNASCDYLWHHMFYKIWSVPLFKLDLKNITIYLKGSSKSSCHFFSRHSQALRAILCASLVTVMGHLSRMESSSGQLVSLRLKQLSRERENFSTIFKKSLFLLDLGGQQRLAALQRSMEASRWWLWLSHTFWTELTHIGHELFVNAT